MPRALNRTGRHGFTLMELMVVVMIAAVITALALPYWAPTLMYSKLEGASRHVGNYGRAAVAYCALGQERVTVRFDLGNQEYWSERWLEEEEGLFDDEEGEDAEEEIDLSSTGLFESLNLTESNHLSLTETSDEAEEIATEMQERFERLFRINVEARLENVDHDGMLADVGPDLSEVSLEDGDDLFEEVKTDLLARTRMPTGVRIESIELGGVLESEGIVDVDVTPFGAVRPVTFVIRAEDGDGFTVEWDPITGGAHVRRGAELPELDVQ